MIYLSGVTSNPTERAIINAGIGLMLNPDSGYEGRVHRYPCFAIDNGCFSDKWREPKWAAWLESLPTDRCLFAVSPDVMGDARESLRRGLDFAPFIRSLGHPVAVVAQDGAEGLDWPWDEIDCLFVGGKQTPNPRDEWKTSPAAESLCRRARNAGTWVHMGRVNSLKRMLRAVAMGVNSVDGTKLKFQPKVALPKLITNVGRANRAPAAVFGSDLSSDHRFGYLTGAALSIANQPTVKYAHRAKQMNAMWVLGDSVHRA